MLILNVGRLLSLGFEKVMLMYTPANSGVNHIIVTLVQIFACPLSKPVLKGRGIVLPLSTAVRQYLRVGSTFRATSTGNTSSAVTMRRGSTFPAM